MGTWVIIFIVNVVDVCCVDSCVIAEPLQVPWVVIYQGIVIHVCNVDHVYGHRGRWAEREAEEEA